MKKSGAPLALGLAAVALAVSVASCGESGSDETAETVLFLQALQLSSGTGVVLAGVSLGLILTAIVGAITFSLERKLPYKKMLIVTGVLIALVLVVLVGNTARTMQGVGWLSIHPLEVETPLWMGFAAEWLRKRELRRTIGAYEESLAIGSADDAIAAPALQLIRR